MVLEERMYTITGRPYLHLNKDFDDQVAVLVHGLSGELESLFG